MRIRNLKPGFFKNELLAELPFQVRLLFQGLWCMADCEGRVEDRPERIRAELFPYDDPDIIRIDESLQRLADKDFIRRYEVDGTRCVWILKFRAHQALSGNERKKPSQLPPFDPNQEKNRLVATNLEKNRLVATNLEKNRLVATNLEKNRLVETVHAPEKIEDNVESRLVATNLEKNRLVEISRADVGHRTKDEGYTIHPRAREVPEEAPLYWRGLDVGATVGRVRDAHPCCAEVSEMAITSGLRLYLPGIGKDGVERAVAAFERHMSGAASHPNPMQKLENYLKKEAAGGGSAGESAQAPRRQEYVAKYRREAGESRDGEKNERGPE